ncbi:hypothetical protein QJS66_05530 [Kocuria rhizophila]|nr:hypothetical protein QJS66_05530 [Kocuria rhizophila]
MRHAVRLAHGIAAPGDTVLMAPAAASMDQFADYAQRGQAFIRGVHEELGAVVGAPTTERPAPRGRRRGRGPERRDAAAVAQVRTARLLRLLLRAGRLRDPADRHRRDDGALGIPPWSPSPTPLPRTPSSPSRRCWGAGADRHVRTVPRALHVYRKAAWAHMDLSVLVSALVFTPLGRGVNGNRNWLVLGGQSIQPSEGAAEKLAMSCRARGGARRPGQGGRGGLEGHVAVLPGVRRPHGHGPAGRRCRNRHRAASSTPRCRWRTR